MMKACYTESASDVNDMKEETVNVFFRDSFQVLPASLATLVQSVGATQLHRTNQMKTIYNVSDATVQSKGIFPYHFLDSFEKLNYPVLPARDEFENIMPEDYVRAQEAWDEFECDNLGDYMRRYLEMDVRQLCDVFQNFRSLTRQQSGLDGAHYMTISQYSLSAALKKINRSIAICTSPKMYRLFERSIRGGIAFCNRHIVTAKNPYCKNAADHELSLLYVDQNNLYGNALRMKLPVADFKFVEPASLNINWRTIDTDGDVGYLLDVDLHYPAAIHDATQHFPLAAEDFEISDALLSVEMRSQLQILNTLRHRPLHSEMVTCRKVVGNCLDKINYVVHFKALQFY